MYSNFSSKVQTFQNDQQAYALNDEGFIFCFLLYSTLNKISKINFICIEIVAQYYSLVKIDFKILFFI